jgi:hypothetical protein
MCLKHEDLSTAKIAKRYVAGWVSTCGYHGPSGKRSCCRSVEFGFLERRTNHAGRGGVGSDR